MSDLKMFSVFDTKAEAYLPPMFFPTRGVAIRAFSQAAADEAHDFCKYSDDYVLFELGTFDPASAVFACHVTPVNLGSATSLRSSN
jgi:hypothetical protein